MKVLFFALSLFFLTGCLTPFEKVGYIRKDRVEAQIQNLKQAQREELDKKIQEISVAKDGLIAQIRKNFQDSVNSLYGAHIGLELIPDKDRLWQIIDNRVNASLAFGPAPTTEAILEQNQLLKEELDEKRISNEALEKRYQIKLTEADNAKKIEKEREETIRQKEAEMTAIKQTHKNELDAKQQELNNINDALIASERKRGEDKSYIEKNKRLIMSVCGVLALASLAGAIWSPVSKREFGIFAAVLGAITIIIPFVQPAHVAIGAGLIFLVVIGLIIKKYGVAQKSSENLINFVQTIKDTKPAIYDQIKDDLIDANSKYSADQNGKVIKIQDSTVEKHVETVLKDFEKI